MVFCYFLRIVWVGPCSLTQCNNHEIETNLTGIKIIAKKDTFD